MKRTMKKLAWILLKVFLVMLLVIVSLITLGYILDPYLTEWQIRSDAAKYERMAEEGVKKCKQPLYSYLQTHYTESHSSEHFALYLNPANGSLQLEEADSILSDCELGYDRYCDDLGLSRDRDYPIRIFAYGDDLVSAVESNAFDAAGYTINNGYSSSYIFTWLGQRGVTMHELFHYLVSDARKDNILPRYDFYFIHGREHTLVTFYADKVVSELFQYNLNSNNWFERYWPEYVANDNNREKVTSALNSDWTFESLFYDNGDAAPFVFYPAFAYVLETHGGDSCALGMLRQCNSSSFPWALIDESKEEFVNHFRAWAKKQPVSPKQAWDTVKAHLNNPTTDSIHAFVNADMPLGLKVYRLMTLAKYFKIQSLRSNSSSATNYKSLTELCLDDIEKFSASLPERQQNIAKQHCEIWRLNPSIDDLTPDSEFTKRITGQTSPALFEYARSIAKGNKKYKCYIVSKYVEIRPMDLYGLYSYYMLSSDEDKPKIAVRIMQHPSVKLSWKLRRSVIMKYLEMEKAEAG